MGRKPNYDFQKRQKEAARKQRKAEKRERKKTGGGEGGGPPIEGIDIPAPGEEDASAAPSDAGSTEPGDSSTNTP
jgi:hypothetical protein